MCDNYFTSYRQSRKTELIGDVDTDVDTPYNAPSASSSSYAPSPNRLDLYADNQEGSAPAQQPSARDKKTRGRKRDAGHVARPRNAFIIFRSEYIRLHRDQEQDQQNELSKQAGKAWHAMTAEQQQVFRDQAALEQHQHKVDHPDYQYTPHSRRTSSQAKTTKSAAKKARVAPVAGPSRAGRASCAVEEDWASSSSSPSSSTSSGSYSPEYVPPQAARVPLTAHEVAVLCPVEVDRSIEENWPPILEYNNGRYEFNHASWPFSYLATNPNSPFPVMGRTLYDFNTLPLPEHVHSLPGGALSSDLLPFIPEDSRYQPYAGQSYSDDGQVDFLALYNLSPEAARAFLRAGQRTL